jgi:hypothetical protein
MICVKMVYYVDGYWFCLVAIPYFAIQNADSGGLLHKCFNRKCVS